MQMKPLGIAQGVAVLLVRNAAGKGINGTHSQIPQGRSQGKKEAPRNYRAPARKQGIHSSKGAQQGKHQSNGGIGQGRQVQKAVFGGGKLPGGQLKFGQQQGKAVF